MLQEKSLKIITLPSCSITTYPTLSRLHVEGSAMEEACIFALKSLVAPHVMVNKGCVQCPCCVWVTQSHPCALLTFKCYFCWCSLKHGPSYFQQHSGTPPPPNGLYTHHSDKYPRGQKIRWVIFNSLFGNRSGMDASQSICLSLELYPAFKT